MAEKPQRESQQGKKRRAEALELEKEAEEWSMPTASGSLGGARKIRLGKRYQAVLPELRTSPVVLPSSSNSSTDVRVNLPRQIFSAQALADSVASNDLHTFLQFSSSLAPGYTHGTSHATAANALHLLHQHNWNVTSASCHLLASHAYTPPPTLSSADDAADLPRAKKQQSIPVKHQQWLVAFYLAFAAPVLTESSLESLRALHRTCPLSATASEAAVLEDYLTRVDDWITAVEGASNETAASSPPSPPPLPSRKKGTATPRSAAAPPTSPADLHALLHTATALRCHELPLARAMTARLEAFELAKTQLLDVLDGSVRPSSKSFAAAPSTKKAAAAGAATTTSVASKSVNLDQVKALHARVRSFGLAFAESAAVDGVLAAAEAVRAEIRALLGQDKVSVPAIRVVLAKVDAIPVDLADDVAPLKVKMTSAQKWLDRARKCMPPTKRQSSRITDTPANSAIANGRSKMNLEAVHELVQCAPVDDESSEMQEMEDLLAYADEWGQRVEAAMAAAVPIDTLRELLEEGDDMPVVMELTTGLRAWIDAREWEEAALDLTAARDGGKRRKKEGAELCSLEDLHGVLDGAADIRRRLGDILARAWQSQIETTIQTTVDAAEAWIAQTQQLLGMATWSKVVGTPAKQTRRGSVVDRRAKGPTSAPAASSAWAGKRPLADLEAVVNELHRPLPIQPPTESQPVKDEDTPSNHDTAATLTALVDLTEYLSPLERLITRGKELVAACAGLDVAAADAFETAVGLVDEMDAFPCRLDQGDALREMVAQAKAWVASVHAVCGKQRAPLSYATRVVTPTTRRVPKKSSLYDKDVPTPAVAPAAAPTPVPSTPSASLDDLRALEATTLAFSFADERARIRDEIAAVVAWQAHVHDALRSDGATAALAGCRQLQGIDAGRAAQWASRRHEAPPAAPTVDDDHAKAAMASVVVDKSNEASADVPTSDGELARPPAAVAMGDALVSVIQVISGCRTRQPDASDAAADGSKIAVDWSPMLAEIDRSLGLIAALDAKAKDDDAREAAIPHDEEASAAERAAVAAVQTWKAHLDGLLSSLNAIVSTAEVSVVTWLLHALEWVLASRTHFVWAADADDSDDTDERASSPLVATIAQGHHLRATVPESLVPSDSNNANWSQATLWPLEQLESQRDATKKWEDSLDKQMQDHTLALAHVDAVLSEADAVHADDRPVWIELKKVKTWLVKARKVLKAKQTAKLPLHTLGNLVDEGGKLKIRTGVWAALQAEHDAAAAWEAQLKASGLDVGQAKIATLVGLLREFDDRRFVVDMDMHREVLVSATEQYCICRQPYDGFMLGCELCDDWFHDTCVGISKEKAEKVADYVCPSCALLHELKRLVGVADELSTELLTNESTSAHEKALSVALRKVKKEERDVDKATMALVELQTQVTAIGQHVTYLDKMIHDADKPALALPSLLQHNHLAHHHALQLFKGYPTPQPSLLRSLPPFPSASTSVPSQQFLQPMPPPSAQATSSPSHGHANGSGGGVTLPPLPNTTASASPLHLLLAKPSGAHGPPDDATAASGTPPAAALPPSLSTASSSQEIELTRFKMEHFKLKQMVVEADAALAQTKERLRLARAAVDSLVTTRDVWRPKAQHWWQQVQFVLAQLVVDKKAFDLRLLTQWAVECDVFCDAFPAVHAMKKVLHAIPWTIDAFGLLHGTPKPSYDALEKVLRENQVHDSKVLLPLRGVLQRTDQWKARTQKTVTKLLAAKKVETPKIQTVLNEYLKMPLTCSWGRKLEELVAALETRDPVLPPPTIDITPPSSPRAQHPSAPTDSTAAPTPAPLKRKPSGSRSAGGGGAARKRVKAASAATDVAEKTVATDVAKKAKASRGSSRPSTAAPVVPDAVS